MLVLLVNLALLACKDLRDHQALKESVDLWDCQATRALKVQEDTEESLESQDQKELKEPEFLDPQEYLVQLDLQALKEKTALEHRELQVHLDQEDIQASEERWVQLDQLVHVNSVPLL